MELPNATMWMVRAEWEGTVPHHFLNEGIAYLGWGETGVIHPETTKEELSARVERANPGYKGVGNATRCIWEFCREVQEGDTVVTYDPQQRLYHVGVVKSDADYGIGIWVDPLPWTSAKCPATCAKSIGGLRSPGTDYPPPRKGTWAGRRPIFGFPTR